MAIQKKSPILDMLIGYTVDLIEKFIPNHKTKLGTLLAGLVTLYSQTIIPAFPDMAQIPQWILGILTTFSVALIGTGVRHAIAKNGKASR